MKARRLERCYKKLAQAVNLDAIIDMGQERGFKVEQDIDFGAGPIDIVWNINVHSALPNIKCGFVVLKAEEGGNQDTEDNQLSLRKIEEAAFRGIRSGLDKVYLVAENDDMAKSVSGKIEWLASHGSLIRLDAISLGLAPEQTKQAVITPSQKRVPQGEKYASRQCASVKSCLKNIIGQKSASAEEENIHLKRVLGNQKLTGIAGREIKSPRGLESFPRIILLSCNI